MTGVAIVADAACLPLPDGSVDLVVTSPPYYGLRTYQDRGTGLAGQLGAEATPLEFVDALVRCTAEWIRVLTKTGSIWVNLVNPGRDGTVFYRWCEVAPWVQRNLGVDVEDPDIRLVVANLILQLRRIMLQ